MRNLIIRLILRSSKIEEQLATLYLALVVVRDGRALGLTFGTVNDYVIDDGAVGECGLEVEADRGVGAKVGGRKGGQGVVGEVVGRRRTLFIAGTGP